MAIRVTDVEGIEHVYDEDGDENGEIETEDIHNNLVIKTDNVFVVFADGKWINVEQDNPHGVDAS